MYAVQTEGLTKRYGSTLALDALDLTVSQGEVYGFLGPNGSGKTTTIRLLLGLHRPTSGSASVFGLDAWRDPVTTHRRLAYVAGEPYLWPQLTGEEMLVFLGRMHGAVDVEYRQALVERFRFEPAKKVRALSKGNRQKIQLVAAFATRADLLVLDEPTSGLDPLMEVAFRETVVEAKDRGQTVFLSSHILGEVEALCDRVGILRQGRLVDEGTLAELRHLSAQTVDVTFAGLAPDLGPLDGSQLSAPVRMRSASRCPAASGRSSMRSPATPSPASRVGSRRSRRSSFTTTALATVSPARALALRTLAGARVRTVSFGFLFFAVAFAVTEGYRTTYPTLAGRLRLARAFGNDKVFRLFYGTPYRLETVGGYASWRAAGVLSLFAAYFGAAAAVRVFRAKRRAAGSSSSRRERSTGDWPLRRGWQPWAQLLSRCGWPRRSGSSLAGFRSQGLHTWRWRS